MPPSLDDGNVAFGGFGSGGQEGIYTDIGGLDLVAHVRQAYPKTRTVLLSAYGSSHVEQEAKRLGVDAFLHKPQPLAEIVKIVYGVVARPPGNP